MAVNIGAELQALPLEYMLSAPLQGAIKSQALACQTTVHFIEKVGLEEDANGNISVRNVSFDYSKQVTNPEDPAAAPEVEVHKLTVPMLAIVPIPYIRIEELTVDFEFKVKETITRTHKTEVTAGGGGNTTVETTAKFGGGFFSFLGGPSATVKATHTSNWNVSTTHKSTSSTTQDRSARITISMKAVQDQMPEGLKTVLDILNKAIISEPK